MDLLKETLVYRTETEEEAVEVIQKFKDGQAKEGYNIGKNGYVLRQKKKGGEVVEEWFVVTVEKKFEV